MRYLIDSGNRIYAQLADGSIYTGGKDDVIADFTAEEVPFTVRQLENIAAQTGLKISSHHTKAELLAEIATQLETLNLGVITMPQTEIARELFTVGVNAGKSEDQVKLDLVNAGFGFKEANKLYKELALESGLVIKAKDRFESAQKYIAKRIDAGSAELDTATAEKIIKDIVKNVSATDEKQALGVIKKFCKEKGIEFKPAKGKRGGRAGGGVFGRVLVWIKENPTADKTSLKAHCEETGVRSVYFGMLAQVLDVVNSIRK